MRGKEKKRGGGGGGGGGGRKGNRRFSRCSDSWSSIVRELKLVLRNESYAWVPKSEFFCQNSKG